MNIDKIQSDMELIKLYFEKIDFKRSDNITEGDMRIDVDTKFVTKGDIHEAKLIITADKSKEMSLKIVAIGDFKFSSNITDIDMQQRMIQTNAISIMFPFVRSQVAIVTSQPGMSPIILPPINVLKLMEEKHKNNN